MYIPLSHFGKLFIEWFSLLLKIQTDVLQIGASFVIKNRFNGYWKSRQLLQTREDLLQIGQNITNECTITGKKGARLLLIVTLDIES